LKQLPQASAQLSEAFWKEVQLPWSGVAFACSLERKRFCAVAIDVKRQAVRTIVHKMWLVT